MLYSFTGGSDGVDPGWPDRRQGGRALRHNEAGGSDMLGTVFKLTPPAKGQTAWTETCSIVSRAASCSDGAYPLAGLIVDKEGALYGTTRWDPVAAARFSS